MQGADLSLLPLISEIQHEALNEKVINLGSLSAAHLERAKEVERYTGCTM